MKILVAGASGFGNLGDDAYKQIMSDYFEGRHEFYFDSPYPDLRYFDEMDHLIIGGGGLIYGENAHLRYMEMYMREAIARDIPFSFRSVGVQPLKINNPENKDFMPTVLEEIKKWKPYLEQAEYISVRSRKDKEILDALLQNNKTFAYPDLCYLIEPANYFVFHKGSSVLIPTTLSMKAGHYDDYTAVAGLSDQAVALQFARDDVEAINTVKGFLGGKSELNSRERLTPREAMAVISRANHVITGRYHGMVFAKKAGVPYTSVDTRYKSLVDDWNSTEFLGGLPYRHLDHL